MLLYIFFVLIRLTVFDCGLKMNIMLPVCDQYMYLLCNPLSLLKYDGLNSLKILF